jgi:Tfp pilus assembly protein PilV
MTWPRGEGGFTVAEILVTSLIVSVGLSAVAWGMVGAARAVVTARAETTAVFLAEARLEELRATALRDWSDVALANGVSAELLPGGYARSTRIEDGAAELGCALPCKRLGVRVTAPADGAGHVPTVDLVTVLARRR